jgi:F-type H+-transporting ATPase subunit delta
MKGSKEARKMSRQLLRNSFTDGKLDQQKISQMVNTVVTERPRFYVDVLKDYQRLVRLEVEKRQAVVESAAPLNDGLRDQVVSKLRERYGEDVSTEFRTNPELLAGLRIKIGDDVWDGSVQTRLNRLKAQV